MIRWQIPSAFNSGNRTVQIGINVIRHAAFWSVKIVPAAEFCISYKEICKIDTSSNGTAGVAWVIYDDVLNLYMVAVRIVCLYTVQRIVEQFECVSFGKIFRFFSCNSCCFWRKSRVICRVFKSAERNNCYRRFFCLWIVYIPQPACISRIGNQESCLACFFSSIKQPYTPFKRGPRYFILKPLKYRISSALS